MAGLDPAIHVFGALKTWMPGKIALDFGQA